MTPFGTFDQVGIPFYLNQNWDSRYKGQRERYGSSALGLEIRNQIPGFNDRNRSSSSLLQSNSFRTGWQLRISDQLLGGCSGPPSPPSPFSLPCLLLHEGFQSCLPNSNLLHLAHPSNQFYIPALHSCDMLIFCLPCRRLRHSFSPSAICCSHWWDYHSHRSLDHLCSHWKYEYGLDLDWIKWMCLQIDIVQVNGLIILIALACTAPVVSGTSWPNRIVIELVCHIA